MDGFSVLPEELTSAAAAIRDRGEQLAMSPVVKYAINPREVGTDVLAAAMLEVQDASRWSVSVLNSTAGATADRLSATAATYEAIDRNQVDTITAIDSPSSDS
ncbi:MAG: hypothetical protein GEV28_34475 [Actinophytocola sp.]|uniref:hypothetical protein n=1 Tax=Actinophytocola sp. TaxID=1872138 RepID=UPI001320A3A0|nr:hypothetical protein [Actinophytocola sp.]MPZ85222.1 hypothetical protein [Actinophytocola sp.]